MQTKDVIGMRAHLHAPGGAWQSSSTYYFHKDHLGSIASITNGAGALVERLSLCLRGAAALK